MLLSEKVFVTINYKNIEKYLNLGYKFETFVNKEGKISVKRNTRIEVKVRDLSVKCRTSIKYRCDYCNKTVEVHYCDYMRHYQDGVKNDKDCCRDCLPIKTKEKLEEKYGEGVTSPYSIASVREKRDKTVMDRYGVSNVFKLDDVKEKTKETIFERYGAEYYTQTEEYKEKAKNTCIEKYGVDNVSKNKDIIEKIKNVQFEKYGDYYANTDEGKEKIRNTNLERYGVECVFQNDDVKNKIKDTMISKYGVHNLMMIPKIAKERAIKGLETKSKMGTISSSRQQIYLCSLFGGELNYLVDNCALDIAFPDDMLYIEYDGSGHNLRVKFGDCSEEEFSRKESNRKYFLKSKGWKEIRIISNKDYIPSDTELKSLLNYSIDWLNKNHSWIKFNIDNNTVETSEGLMEYGFKDLRKIKEEDLRELRD